ncbi:MAG: SAM-dependent methyltransferase [Myxococcota bacterium]|jgi:SAM-dependent methyltransferase
MDAERAYDAVPYTSKPFPETHPDRMFLVAQLVGLDPPPVHTARILELGCASGGNLVPIAARLPGTTCVGVDISGVQIRDGQARVAALGLTNCTLIHANLADLEPLGPFDYVLVHGVWSWVPPAVQEAILGHLNVALADGGLATVSYNTYPGWYRRGMVREMCRWHVRDLPTEPERVEQARTLVAFLLSALEGSTSHHAEAIRQEARLLQQTDETYLTHGLLAEVNTPCWFHEMAERVQAAGLTIVGDADLSTLLHDDLSAGARGALGGLDPGSVRHEQLADLVRNRTFRRSILARAGARPCHPPRWTPVLDCTVSTLARQVDRSTFVAFRGSRFTVRDPLLVAALGLLVARRPQTVGFGDLLERACARVGRPPDGSAAAALAQSLLALMAKRAVQLYPRDLGIVVAPGPRPVACPVIRERAAQGDAVPNLRHESFVLRTMDRHLVQLLDGTADTTALVHRLEALHASGALTVEEGGAAITGRGAFRAACRVGLTEWIDAMARAGFLVG